MAPVSFPVVYGFIVVIIPYLWAVPGALGGLKYWLVVAGQPLS